MSDAVKAGEARIGLLKVRLVVPDRWLEHVADLPVSTRVQDAKVAGLRALLARAGDDPADYFVEFAERRVRDESLTLGELGLRSGDMLAIRAYDLGHYRRFDG